MYMVILFSTYDLAGSLPSNVVLLLQEFKDVFPKELPQGLPPIWGIKHQINFISSTTIPNQPTYPLWRPRNFKGK